MSPWVHTKDLIDAHGLRKLLRLTHVNSVHTYLRRYKDMPRPVLNLGAGRPSLWLKPAITKWMKARSEALR
ncbi:MAG: hypothetical protein ACJ790_22655 [Myxococcaceae bacterium]